LSIADLVGKGTATAIDHEDVGRWPWSLFAGAVVFALRETTASIDSGVAKIGVSVVDRLLDRTSVWRDAKESLAMIVATSLGERVWDL
jgi:hypothetical protein